MTVIDGISFSFRMTDEQFARDLYAGWDGFCRRCVTDVMDEFFCQYDGKDSFVEMDLLDLDLGAIRQDDFMDEFPARLREALERNFVPRVREVAGRQSSARNPIEWTGGHQTVPPAVVVEKRFENFLHYLEYGFCLPEWSGSDFDPGKELELFRNKDFAGRIAALIVSRPYAAVRLLIHAADSDFGMDIMRAVISSDAIGENEKRRHIAVTLEHSPQTVIRFIHEIGESGILDGMAGLIENPQVRDIMEAETESHAEIDLPEYWYRLYGWLLEYYPFDGVPMFGDKQHFRLHLNRSLLSFIHGRTYPSYLSKAELTVQFLMAVFGSEHYISLLDFIYHSQPLNPDGSPAGGDGYVWELYYVLMRLSLINAGSGDAGRALYEMPGIGSGAGNADKKSGPEAFAGFMDYTESLGQWLEAGQEQATLDRLQVWLMSPDVSDTAKSQLLRHYARWQPKLLWKLIVRSSWRPSGDFVSGADVPLKWASWLDRDTLLEMVSGISMSLGETLRQTISVMAGKCNIPDSASVEALIIFLASHPSDNAYYMDPQTVVSDYISALEPVIPADRYMEVRSHNRLTPVWQGTEAAETPVAVQPEYIEVPNAGLCLLAVWFTRLFDMLGLLEVNAGGKKDFRDIASRIRAIFILQRLVTDEKREYREQELALNRILAGCPFHVPLPKTLELTDNEIRTAESMLSGVKANWDKMKGTSVKGFQRSFIERPGKLEQRESKWVLYVEERSYDILLDSLPWSYRNIRLPWLKKRINVIWRDKEEFDVDNN